MQEITTLMAVFLSEWLCFMSKFSVSFQSVTAQLSWVWDYLEKQICMEQEVTDLSQEKGNRMEKDH